MKNYSFIGPLIADALPFVIFEFFRSELFENPSFISKRQVAPNTRLKLCFRDYFLFASLFPGTLHMENTSVDRGKTLSISSLFVTSIFGSVSNK